MTIRHLFELYSLTVGLVIGSYLNVVIHRLPRRESTVLLFSKCPNCGARILGRDNVPVLSYLLLRGRCRGCRTPISWRYPLVEMLTAGLFVAVFKSFGLTLQGFVAAVFGCLLIALAGIDAEHFILPDAITIPATLAALAVSPWLPWIRWQDALIGAVAAGGGLWLVAHGWYLLRREEGMGLGDVKMLAMVGAFLGWQGALVTIFVASLVGAIVGVALIAARRGDLHTRLPFGVFLAGGAMTALFVGPRLVTTYIQLL